jgi:hypothetical protein
VFYLSRKILLAKDIHLDLVHTLEPDAMSFFTVMLYLRGVRCVSPMDLKTAPDHDHEPDNSDQTILAALSEQLFASVRELSRLIHISKSVVH